MASLVKAYKKRYPGGGEIVLRHDFQVIEEKTKVNVLTTRPPHNFIALEAVRTQELETRKTAIITATLNRAPLTEVTNTASLTRSKSLSTPKDDSRPVFKAYSPRIIRPATSSPSMGQHVSSQSPTSLPQPDQIGWEDFLFERLELHRQNVEYGRQTAQRHHSAYACDKSSQAEWLTLSEGQKSYFVERGKRIRSTSNSIDLPTQRLEHGAFWRFYYDGYFAVKAKTGTDPHHDFDEQRRRMEEWVNQWNNWNLTARKLLMDRVQVHITSALGRGIFDNLPKSNTTRSSLSRLDNAPSLKREMSPSLQTVKDASPQDDTVKKEEDLHGEAETGSREAGSAFVPLSMSELFDGRTPEQLEKSVEKGVQLLGDIQRTLQAQPSQDATQWLQALEKVHKQAVRSKTVIGVVGATGAGKSSVINAMLDEERLVPTNCMRACTAVVTEISYNYEDGAPYKAQIEFISRDDWQKMLKVMFQDLIDGSGQVSHECTNEDSESGIAYAQVKAVYPKLTKEEMEKVPIERLMEHDNVACLGTTRTIEADDALVFYKKLQQYVDSKEKNSALKEKGEKEKKKPWEMEFWPLIRVVRLHVKAPALATGAVIVDLPGVHDSNQARAAVAQGYMKQCTGLWIVAPITRAVDDKSAKNLLGDSFKRQLKMDGGYNAVTFICSKTDDISITEAQDSLGLEEELGPMWTKWDELRQKKTSLKRKIEGLKETKSDISAAMEAADEELEVWEKLQEQSSAGQEVFMPKPKSQKRKRVGKPSKPRKKVNYADPDTEDDLDQQSDDVDSDAGSDYASSNTSDDQREPLTEDDITNKITELRITKKEGRHERNKVDEEIKILRRQIEEVDKENEAIDALLSGKCISGRNEYSRGAIRQDYASGIRELDQELAEEADAAIFNPEVDARDYDEVARNLPVFCVSSRAYQKLKGRLPRDKMPPGFNHIDETEVPALQAHCIQLTGADRQASCRRFLNSMFQLLNSLRLWASNDGTGKNLSEGQLQREGQILNDRLTKLDSVSSSPSLLVVHESSNAGVLASHTDAP